MLRKPYVRELDFILHNDPTTKEFYESSVVVTKRLSERYRDFIRKVSLIAALIFAPFMSVAIMLTVISVGGETFLSLGFLINIAFVLCVFGVLYFVNTYVSKKISVKFEKAMWVRNWDKLKQSPASCLHFCPHPEAMYDNYNSKVITVLRPDISEEVLVLSETFAGSIEELVEAAEALSN